MGDSKMPHAVVSLIVSGASAAWAWFGVHGHTVASIVAVVAGLYSIAAARKTYQLRKRQLKEFKD